MVGGQRGRGGDRRSWSTSLSAPVVVSSSFSSSSCMELSSCCRIISWNWAIPLFATPLLRPGGEDRDGLGIRVSEFRIAFIFIRGVPDSVIASGVKKKKVTPYCKYI